MSVALLRGQFTSLGFSDEGAGHLLGIESLQVPLITASEPEPHELPVGQHVVELPRVHDFGAAHAIPAAMSIEVLAGVDALVVTDGDAAVVVSVADNHAGRDERVLR